MLRDLIALLLCLIKAFHGWFWQPVLKVLTQVVQRALAGPKDEGENERDNHGPSLGGRVPHAGQDTRERRLDCEVISQTQTVQSTAVIPGQRSLSRPREVVEKIDYYAPLLAHLKAAAGEYSVGSCILASGEVCKSLISGLKAPKPSILDWCKVVAVQVLFDGDPNIMLEGTSTPLVLKEGVVLVPFKKYENTAGLWMKDADATSEDEKVQLEAATHYVVLCKLTNKEFVILDGNEAQFEKDDRLLQTGKKLRDCECVMYIERKEFKM
eukprot:CAMPEP_0181356832 /NCGR_PEP_ID=MMETSP1106-20121128/4633_1 /TAXON_ID=81844 /ORGANISM="Mantoniella antarctica, Strain SL-175" /LENGTH=267 /DNA_ID=CAMNT_0023469645 /DNA_START=250 /DNA_END=1053 /DNA_ORIENTATION=+